ESLAATMLDQVWHQLTPEQVTTDAAAVEAFEAQALAAVGLDYPLVPPRYRSTYFIHSFGGGYDAGYYSYIWSEVLDADTVEWFTTDRKSTRLNSSHVSISYAVFCLKKKKNKHRTLRRHTKHTAAQQRHH